MALSLKLTSGHGQPAGTSEEMVVPRGAPFVIGRDPAAHWVLPDPQRHVSGIHCVIESDGDAFLLDDRSANGTFVNGCGTRLEGKHRLAHGDVISLGHYVIAVAVIRDAAARATPAPDDIWQTGPASGADLARGGDPAAVAAMTPFGSSSMTVIRPAPRPGARNAGAAAEPTPEAAPQAAADAMPASPPAAPPEAASPSSAAPSGAAPAQPPAADPFLPLARAMLESLARAERMQGRLLREIGSRSRVIRRSMRKDALEMLSDPDKILAGLASGPADRAALLIEAAARRVEALAEETEKLLRASEAAARSMAEALDPVGAAGAGEDVYWLEGYRHLWDELAEAWSEGFAEAFRLHVVTAYDTPDQG